MSNNSSTGGYLVPAGTAPLPGSLTLEQFIQTVLVGISGLTSTLVRPKFQSAPPKNPDVTVDWISFAINIAKADTYAFVSAPQDDGTTYLNRQEKLEVQCSFSGPNGLSNYSIVRDGFQIPQNLEALLSANMSFQEMTEAIRGPDLINERWVTRFESTIILVRQVVRTYPILSFTSASGVVHTVLGQTNYDLPWQAPEAE
jgi:hypothetical protein